MAGFRKRHPEFKTHSTGRPVEVERAMKTQPEITVQYLRLLLHAFALRQIHEHVAKQTEPGRACAWEIREGLVERKDGSGNNAEDGVVSVKDGEFFNDALGMPLEWPQARYVLNGDEKPIMPDCPKKAHVVGARAIGYGRSVSWTLMPWTTANGNLLHTTLILRGQSISQDVVEAVNDVLPDMVIATSE